MKGEDAAGKGGESGKFWESQLQEGRPPGLEESDEESFQNLRS
jgi:hypothetical protein